MRRVSRRHHEPTSRCHGLSCIAIWIHKAVPALDDDKPLEVISRGDCRRVAKLVSALEESPAV